MNQRLIHDHAWTVAVMLVTEVFDSILMKSEKRLACEEVYERVKAGMESLLLNAEREAARLKPSRN